jgi:hypothetical protein
MLIQRIYLNAISNFGKFFCNGFANAFAESLFDNYSVVIAIVTTVIITIGYVLKVFDSRLFTIAASEIIFLIAFCVKSGINPIFYIFLHLFHDGA